MTDHDQSAPADRQDADVPPEPLVDWEGAGRRILRTGGWTCAVAVVAWLAWSAVTGGWAWRTLGNLFGLALFVVFLAELWVVGGSALRGMLRAGERGERLASHDVGLLPPQLRRGGRMVPGPLQQQPNGNDDEPATGDETGT